MANRTYNFGAGPAKIPRPVLERVQAELLDYDNTGMSVMELSHRSKAFDAILQKTKTHLTTLLSIPDNYEILFMQGGATTQFSAVFFNLVGAKQKELNEQGDATLDSNAPIVIDYIITGVWSAKAAEEAERLAAGVKGRPVHIHRVLLKDSPLTASGTPSWALTDPLQHPVAYVYYCSNETVHGIEFHSIPECHPSVPLVTDVSSNFLSRPVPVSALGVMYGGAQKNLGPAGVSLVIIRKDLLVGLDEGPLRPLMLDYATMAAHGSMYNTPPTFSIYMVGLMLEWLLEQGGLEAIEKRNIQKADKLYAALDQSTLYTAPVQREMRSRMNVVFKMAPELEGPFFKGAEERRMLQLKGHRSIGNGFG
ncbi:phosphoserine aminotransferase [Spinellus fusiger]|nr:phosphoserine aminotransferase [Spinellus fusiger]